ncbi:MAG TPA: class I SAM-dependent methyltransferase [Puia sp.]|nr:class I SAM-dependent methyltransferase [Puia sp.]
MQESHLEILRCPITGSKLQLQTIATGKKSFSNIETAIILEGILWADHGLFYPVIEAVPRLIPEAIIDYENFLRIHVPDFDERKQLINKDYLNLISYAFKKNKRTKESFAFEWSFFRYNEDKTWDAGLTGMLNRFLRETDESKETIKGKLIFDVGCGNGVLDILLGGLGASVLAMDLSKSIVKANEKNNDANVFFVQGDVQFPPVPKESFDIVQCSGILIHTNNTESSFAVIEPSVKRNGKLSVWLYHPRKDFLHNIFNSIRNVTSRLPLKVQYYLYLFTLFPLSFIIKRIKGNKQNAREMMVNILDWFTPQYRWEHEHDEVEGWFEKRGYKNVKITTDELFGFNITGEKAPVDIAD